MKNMKIIYASILLLCGSNSMASKCYGVAPRRDPYEIPMSVGQACPVEKIFDLPGSRVL